MTDGNGNNRFEIKDLRRVLEENQEEANKLLHKQELYPFVIHLLNESNTGNTLYPFLMRVLEENKELVKRLFECQQAYKHEMSMKHYYENQGDKTALELKELNKSFELLKKENETLKSKIAKSSKKKKGDTRL